MMQNIRPQYMTRKIHTAVQVIPVKMASSGTRWIRKNGMEARGFIRGCGRRSELVGVGSPMTFSEGGMSPARGVGNVIVNLQVSVGRSIESAEGSSNTLSHRAIVDIIY